MRQDYLTNLEDPEFYRQNRAEIVQLISRGWDLHNAATAVAALNLKSQDEPGPDPPKPPPRRTHVPVGT